jgi:hypothetical protein
MRTEAEMKRAIELCQMSVSRATKRQDMNGVFILALLCGLKWANGEHHQDALQVSQLLAGLERDFPLQTTLTE